MKEFRQVAQVYAELAQLYILNRSVPAYKTGNLYDRVGLYNTYEKMVTIRPSKSTTKFKLDIPSVNLSLSFAPPGARYGEIVHEGTGLGRNSIPRPFAEEAANDRVMQKTINDAMKGIVNDTVLPQIRARIDKSFIKLLSKRN